MKKQTHLHSLRVGKFSVNFNFGVFFTTYIVIPIALTNVNKWNLILNLSTKKTPTPLLSTSDFNSISWEKSALFRRSQTLKMFFKFAKLWTDASTAIHKSLFVQQLFLNSSLTISNVHLVHSGYASSLFRTELARQMIPTYNPLPKTSAKTSALISSASNCQDWSTQGAQIRKRKTAKNDPVEAQTTVHTNATKHFICRENTVDVRVQLWDQTNRFFRATLRGFDLFLWQSSLWC